jgi:Tfp pilus assembly protein FimT
MTNDKGLTVLELLVTIGIFWILLLLTAPGLSAFLSRMEFHAALRGVTAGLSTARCQAIRDNRAVRAEIAGGRLSLSRDDGQGWREFRGFDLGNKVTVRANSRPVFSPLGGVSPLCTVTLERRGRVCRVVVSMYGRVRVYDGA